MGLKLRVTLALIAIVALAGCTTSPPAEGGEKAVTFGTEAAYPPFEDLIGGTTIVGFDPDIIREISNRTTYDITLQNMGFRAIIPSIQNGQIQGGISAFTITDERKEQVDFSISYYDNTLLVAVRSETTDITKADDLKTKKVCTQAGTTSETWLREEADATNDTALFLPSFPPCVSALEREDVDAMMIDRAVVRGFVTNSTGKLKTAFEIPVDEQFGIAISKDDKDLLNAVNGALSAMKSDGTLQRLADKWQV